MAFPYFIEGGGGYVYLVHEPATGLYKVGQTVRLDERLRLLANGTRSELWLVWYVASNDHKRLEVEWQMGWLGKRVTGEWFRLTEGDVSHFKSFLSVRYAVAAPTAYVPVGDPLYLPTAANRRPQKKLLRLGEPITRRQIA